jgi:hypothetical protein
LRGAFGVCGTELGLTVVPGLGDAPDSWLGIPGTDDGSLVGNPITVGTCGVWVWLPPVPGLLVGVGGAAGV